MSKIKKIDRIAHLEFQVTWLTNSMNELLGTEGLEFQPQLKQLDQSVFDGLDEKWRFAAVDLSGEAWVYREQPKIDKGDDRWLPSNTPPNSIGTGYDTSNWQNSLIERDTAELMGSDLCRAMLERGDKYVMCAVENHYVFIAHYDDGLFLDTEGFEWHEVTPVGTDGTHLTEQKG